MVRGLITLMLIFLSILPVFAEETRTIYNPFTNNFDYILSDSAYEVRRAYDSGKVVYEGWTMWLGADADTSAEIWRISKRIYDGTDMVHVQYAGDGFFLHAWDSRTTYFDSGAPQYLKIDGTYYFLIDATHKLRIQ